MDPRSRLTSGQEAERAGRYEDALREYVWFHEHALEHDRAYYGVRLSFALGYWMELAGVYPAALDKLKEIRDQKVAVLRSGGGDRALFHDVESINQCLGVERETYDLFVAMVQHSPMLAATCADIATGAIIKAGDFALAEKYSASPEDALLRYSEDLNEDVADRSGSSEHKAIRTDAYIHIYCDRVKSILAILDGLGKVDDAGHTREWAVALVASKPIRARVGEKLNEGI